MPEKIRGLIHWAPRGRPISTSLWIRDWLWDVEYDYVMNMWRNLKKDLKPRYAVPNYTNFAKYVYYLRKLKLIKRIRTEASFVRTAIDRQYYGLVMPKYDDPAWYRPQRVLYPRKKIRRKKR